MTRALALEFLGTNERVDEIGSEQHGDAQADKGFVHLALLSEASAGARVEAHENEDKKGEADVDEIGHELLHGIGWPATICSYQHKGSIPNPRFERKDRIKTMDDTVRQRRRALCDLNAREFQVDPTVQDLRCELYWGLQQGVEAGGSALAEAIMPTTVASELRHSPWNKGRLIGQKRPLKPKDVWTIRVRLPFERHTRDLALFNLAIDSKLRGCDLVRLQVSDVCVGGRVRERAVIVQKKTGRPVQFELTEQTRQSVQEWLNMRRMANAQYVFAEGSYNGQLCCCLQKLSSSTRSREGVSNKPLAFTNSMAMAIHRHPGIHHKKERQLSA